MEQSIHNSLHKHSTVSYVLHRVLQSTPLCTPVCTPCVLHCSRMPEEGAQYCHLPHSQVLQYDKHVTVMSSSVSYYVPSVSTQSTYPTQCTHPLYPMFRHYPCNVPIHCTRCTDSTQCTHPLYPIFRLYPITHPVCPMYSVYILYPMYPLCPVYPLSYPVCPLYLMYPVYQVYSVYPSYPVYLVHPVYPGLHTVRVGVIIGLPLKYGGVIVRVILMDYRLFIISENIAAQS